MVTAIRAARTTVSGLVFIVDPFVGVPGLRTLRKSNPPEVPGLRIRKVRKPGTPKVQLSGSESLRRISVRQAAALSCC